MAFAAPADVGEEAGFFSSFPVDRIFDLIKILIIAAVGLFALRMLRERRGADASAAGGVPALATGPDGLPALQSGAAAVGVAQPAQIEGGTDLALIDQEIALAQVDGRVKLSALKRIGEAVAERPAESTSVIRQWMNS
jgi:flagellar M-ring protein FliF